MLLDVNVAMIAAVWVKARSINCLAVNLLM